MSHADTENESNFKRAFKREICHLPSAQVRINQSNRIGLATMQGLRTQVQDEIDEKLKPSAQ